MSIPDHQLARQNAVYSSKISGERSDEPEEITRVDEQFIVVAKADPLSIYGEYVDQFSYDTYDEAKERGQEILKHYPAFEIKKVFIR